nr:EOG090X0BWK [Cyclestheria hislopi]
MLGKTSHKNVDLKENQLLHFYYTGYARVILGVGSLYFMPTNYVVACWLYILSGILDAFDGHAARLLNQSTKFGAMLDMLTDRCATMCLLATLSVFYPSYLFAFQLVMAIDISCHWIHLHTSTMLGKTSHKNVDLKENQLLHFYYTSRPFLFLMCAGNELFYSMLYLLHFTYGPTIFGISLLKGLAIILFPVAVLKVVLAIMQGSLAWRNLGHIDIKEREEAEKKK